MCDTSDGPPAPSLCRWQLAHLAYSFGLEMSPKAEDLQVRCRDSLQHTSDKGMQHQADRCAAPHPACGLHTHIWSLALWLLLGGLM